MTYAHAREISPSREVVVKNIQQGLCHGFQTILVIAGEQPNSEFLHRNKTLLEGEALDVAKLCVDFSDMLKEKFTSVNVGAYIVHPNSPLERHEVALISALAKQAAGQKAYCACTIGLGLWRMDRVDGDAGNSAGHAAKVLIKPAIVGAYF